MTNTHNKICAIYTRKSSEDGLEQDFNSLHAQRESCEAYILSQKSEGWQASQAEYDDGGFSGGTLERPGLNKLIADIKVGKIHIVVVYKIDRLTRSLMDFSKLVEIFDAHDVTFISVTQSFNTTTSMGRLTLNMLLSFAQFEREVTGERIRDKIAASKKKGMWMGGFPPMGYQRVDGKLVIKEDEAQLVQLIFEEYLKSGSVKEVKTYLQHHGYCTPKRVSKKGREYGNAEISRGHIYRILQNPVYIGQVQHKDKIYDGQHKGIIDPDLFKRVQEKLKDAAPVRETAITKSGTLLQGKLYDLDNTLYTPTYTTRKGKRYSYYISQNLLQFKDHPKGILARFPASEIENLVTSQLKVELRSAENLAQWLDLCQSADREKILYLKDNMTCNHLFIRSIMSKVIIFEDNLKIDININALRNALVKRLDINLPLSRQERETLSVPFRPQRSRHGELILSDNTDDPLGLPPHEVKQLVCGIVWRDELFSGKTFREIGKDYGVAHSYIQRSVYNSFEILKKLSQHSF